jgi:hypothetical protein
MKKTDAYHKWVEWSAEDGVYVGKCPDLISGINGDDPVRLYADLEQVVEDVVSQFEATGRPLPPPRVRPMQDVGCRDRHEDKPCRLRSRPPQNLNGRRALPECRQ